MVGNDLLNKRHRQSHGQQRKTLDQQHMQRTQFVRSNSGIDQVCTLNKKWCHFLVGDGLGDMPHMDGSVPRQLLLFQCRNQHRQVVPVPFEIFHCDEKNGKTTETQETKRNNIRHSKENVFTTTTTYGIHVRHVVMPVFGWFLPAAHTSQSVDLATDVDALAIEHGKHSA